MLGNLAMNLTYKNCTNDRDYLGISCNVSVFYKTPKLHMLYVIHWLDKLSSSWEGG